MSQARSGKLAGSQPLIDGVLKIARFGQMIRQDPRLALDEVGEMLLQHRCRAGVQFPPPYEEQGAVCGVLHQRVLEEIGGLRGDAATEQQSGLGETIEPEPQVGRHPLCHLLDQVVAEFAANHRTDLRDLFGNRSKPVEAGDQ
jgi:hypothetical protein